MPVTIKPTTNEAQRIQTWYIDYEVEDVDDFYLLISPEVREASLLAVRSSYDVTSGQDRTGPSTNGFFLSFFNAYNKHHHVRFRADDVWISVLTLLSGYLQAHPNKISHLFNHTGKKNLMIVSAYSREKTDYIAVVKQFVELLRDQVNDEKIVDWMTPNFSTTTETDRAAASVVIAATMQNLVTYNLVTYCGIPSITLLGCQADYEALLEKLDFLYTLGEEPSRFADLLKPIVSRMVSTFDDPAGMQEFWSQAIDKETKKSGQTVFTGWMTAFCFWDNQGKCQYDASWPDKDQKESLLIDGAIYQPVRGEDVPVACCKMPMTLMDLQRGEEVELQIYAGVMGITCSQDQSAKHLVDKDGKAVFDTVAPQPGWFVCEPWVK